MKGIIIWAGITLLNINLSFIPKADLFIVWGIMMVIDFGTGVTKAILLGQQRTSRGYRQTIIKFLQYGGAILISMGISYLAINNPDINKKWSGLATFMSWFNSGLLLFIIMIEVLSIIENIYSLNPKSAFAKNLLRPALKILTIELKKNPLTKLTIETEEEIDPKQVKITKQK